MSAETQNTLTKVDSLIDEQSAQGKEQKKGHRRGSSTVTDVYNIADLGKFACY
jgi:hypothetical protein